MREKTGTGNYELPSRKPDQKRSLNLLIVVDMVEQ